MKKWMLCLLCFSLHASVPDWAFDDVHKGWSSDALAKTYFHYSEMQRQWAWEILGKLPLNGSETILDFGCGDGKITAQISRLIPRGKILGVDLAPEMLHIAHIKFPPCAYPNLTFKRSRSLTFSDCIQTPTYDVICSFAVFHLVADPLETLKNLKSALKPNGKLVLVIPMIVNPNMYRAANEMFAKYGLESPWSKQSNQERATMRTLEGCSYFLKEAGFDILSLEVTETINPFYDLEELIIWMEGTVSANWNIPAAIRRDFFTDFVHRLHEIEPGMIDEEGRVLFETPRIHAMATS